MGKLKEIFRKIGKRLGLIKLEQAQLEEGKIEIEEAINEEIKEETQKESFKEKIAKAAIEDKTDPTKYSGETLLANILEELGVNGQITQNLKTSHELCMLAQYVLNEKGVENINKENIEDVKAILKYNLDIQENGDVSYTEKAYDKNLGEKQNRQLKRMSRISFSARDKGDVEVCRKSTSTTLDAYGNPVKNENQEIRTQLTIQTRTINKDGIEMVRVNETKDRNIEMSDVSRDAELDKMYFDLQTEKVTTRRYKTGIADIHVERNSPFKNMGENYSIYGKSWLYGEYMDTLAVPAGEIEGLKNAHREGRLQEYQKSSNPELYSYGREGHEKETDEVNQGIMKQIKNSKINGRVGDEWKIKSSLEKMAQEEGIEPQEQEIQEK